MKRQLSSNRRLRLPGLPLLVAGGALLACGGTTTFSDTTPIRIAVAPRMADPEPPPPPKKEVKIRDNRVEISEKIQFAYNDSKVLEVSFAMLDELAKTLAENPHVQHIRIEGHASEEGSDDHNMRLSRARAHAVRAYLIAKGIKADRLSAKGFGESRPVASNDSEAGREQNRRVEFHITKQEVTKEKVEIDPATGEEKVIEKSSDAEQEEAEG